jgi:hypothetical protein
MLASALRHPTCRTSRLARALSKNRPYSSPAAAAPARRTRLMAAEDIGAGLSSMPPSASGILLNELDQVQPRAWALVRPLPAARGDRAREPAAPRPGMRGACTRERPSASFTQRAPARAARPAPADAPLAAGPGRCLLQDNGEPAAQAPPAAAAVLKPKRHVWALKSVLKGARPGGGGGRRAQPSSPQPCRPRAARAPLRRALPRPATRCTSRRRAARPRLPPCPAPRAVFVNKVDPNYAQPWQKCPQRSSSGSAFILDIGRRWIMTNAHVVRRRGWA